MRGACLNPSYVLYPIQLNLHTVPHAGISVELWQVLGLRERRALALQNSNEPVSATILQVNQILPLISTSIILHVPTLVLSL